LDSWKREGEIVEKLRRIGFRHIHPRERGHIFLSRIGPTKYGDTHLHVVKKGSKRYRQTLAFRDYLRKHRGEVERYFELKLLWLKQAEGNRSLYTAAKESYIKQVLRRTQTP